MGAMTNSSLKADIIWSVYHYPGQYIGCFQLVRREGSWLEKLHEKQAAMGRNIERKRKKQLTRYYIR